MQASKIQSVYRGRVARQSAKTHYQMHVARKAAMERARAARESSAALKIQAFYRRRRVQRGQQAFSTASSAFLSILAKQYDQVAISLESKDDGVDQFSDDGRDDKAVNIS